MTTEEILHTLKAYHYYLYSLNYCGFNKVTAQYIKDQWEQDYELIENVDAIKF